MESKDNLYNIKAQLKSNNSDNKFRELKSDYFIQLLFNIIPKAKSLELVKYNKYMQKRININITVYKDYSEIYSPIEIEIITKIKKYENDKFINIEEKDKNYYHIYFNDNKEKEIKRTYLNVDDKVSKINIIIDYQVKSFYRLFSFCYIIEFINFKKFYRNNITNMSWMFNRCFSLKEINFTNFNTNNVTTMSGMFYICNSLKELDLSNFNTNNVTDMSAMFFGCTKLKELIVTNFNTNNVTDMHSMFLGCSSLNLSKFNHIFN